MYMDLPPSDHVLIGVIKIRSAIISSYYKVVVFIVPLQGLNAILLTDAVD